MIYNWWYMSDEEQMEMDGKTVWRYRNIPPTLIKPQKGILKLEDGTWRFYKNGKKGKGVSFHYYYMLADTEAEAVADYNEAVENSAREYDEAAENIKKELIPFTGSVHDPIIYPGEEVQNGFLNGRLVYQFRYVPALRAGSPPHRLKPVQVQVHGITIVSTSRVDKYGKVSEKSRFAESVDYFAETKEDAVLKYNELVRASVKQYEEMAAELRKEKV